MYVQALRLKTAAPPLIVWLSTPSHQGLRAFVGNKGYEDNNCMKSLLKILHESRLTYILQKSFSGLLKLMRMPTLNIPIKIAISAGIVALLLSRMDFSAIGAQLAQVQVGGIFWGGVFILSQIGLLAWRWADLINIDHEGPSLTYRESLKITLASLLANVLFITSISGLVVRVGLTMHYGVGLAKTVCAAITDRLMTLVALVIMAALFVPFFDRFVGGALHNAAYATIAVLVFTVMIFIPLFYSRAIKDMILSSPKLTACVRYMLSIARDRGVFLRIVVNSLTAQLFYFISVYFIALSTGAQFTFFDLMSVLPVITLVASLPVSFGGWGIREGAFVFGLGLIGIPMETAFVISVEIGLLTMLATILAGVPALLSMNLQKIGMDIKTLLNKDNIARQG